MAGHGGATAPEPFAWCGAMAGWREWQRALLVARARVWQRALARAEARARAERPGSTRLGEWGLGLGLGLGGLLVAGHGGGHGGGHSRPG